MAGPERTGWDDGYFVNPDGRTLRGLRKDDSVVGETEWISDGYAYIDSILESHAKNSVDRYFVIRGKPVHGNEFRITLAAKDASEGRKLRSALVNEFGIDQLGQLNLAVIQRLSNAPKYIKLVNRPQWLDDRLIAPGLVIDDIEYNLERKVAVDFSDIGDEDTGLEAIYSILKVWNPGDIALLLGSFFGAPVIARLWPDDRFAVFLVGITGTLKTAAVMLLSSLYGTRYSLEANLVRWGDGATSNATEHLAAMVGPFPFVIDNFKSYTDQDPGRLQRMIHAILEGTEKDRLNRDSNLRSAEEYQCLPVITGENYPGQDAASRARIVQIDWSGPIDVDKVTDAQKHIKDLNALGKAWCIWLSSQEGKTAMDDIAARFDLTRTSYLKEANGAINAGRLATNAAIILLIWDLLKACPITADLADEYEEVLKLAIEDHIFHSRSDVSENLDAEKFVSWLQAELEVGRYLVSSSPLPVRYYEHNTETIGHYRDGELFILPSVLSSKLLPTWQRTTNGVRADRRALLRQLAQLGYLQYNKKEQIFTHSRWVDGTKKRVLVFSWNKIVDEDGTIVAVPDNRDALALGTDGTPGTAQEMEKFCSGNSEQINRDTTTTLQHNNNTCSTCSICSNTSIDNDPNGTKTEQVDNSPSSRERGILKDQTDSFDSKPSPDGIKTQLQAGSQKEAEKAEHFKAVAEKHTKAPQSTDRVKVRFVKEYRTKVPRPGEPNAFDDRIYRIDEVTEFQRWKAEDLLARGIVELLA